MSPAVMKLLVVFRRRALDGSGPTSMTFRAMTLFRKGEIIFIATGGPATAISSWPLSARGVAPKTGVAMNIAPAAWSWDEMTVEVLGWTVVVSTMILSLTDPEEMK